MLRTRMYHISARRRDGRPAGSRALPTTQIPTKWLGRVPTRPYLAAGQEPHPCGLPHVTSDQPDSHALTTVGAVSSGSYGRRAFWPLCTWREDHRHGDEP